LSIDKSLVIKGKLAKKKSVLTRAEKLKALKEEGRWKEGESILGLPKVKVAKAGK
jgi:small basic protein (TIGR04137 family)